MTEYRFIMQYGEDISTKRYVFPIWKDDASLDYEQESGQQFFRAKVNGKFTFVRADYEAIMAQPFETEYRVYIQKYNRSEKVWQDYCAGKFYRTDCTINEYDGTLVTQLDYLDRYNKVLAGMEREYDLIKLAPDLRPMILHKRPIWQVYLPNTNRIVNYMGGNKWERDSLEVNGNQLNGVYSFSCAEVVMTCEVSSQTHPEINGTYIGEVQYEGAKTVQTDEGAKELVIYGGNITSNDNRNYYLKVERNLDHSGTSEWVKFVVYRKSDDTGVVGFPFFKWFQGAIDNLNAYIQSEGQIVLRVKHRDMRIYQRLLLDVEEISGTQTYARPTEDITDEMPNYHYVVPTRYAISEYSTRYSTTPTEFGLYKDNLYYTSPYIGPWTWVGEYVPIYQNEWREGALFLDRNKFDLLLDLEKSGRKPYTLKDAMPIYGVIRAFLNEIDPTITHEGTAEYSEFLYGENNPISANTFRLYVTPKSNILSSEYTEEAKKALTTFKTFTDMLKNTLHAYWWIDEQKRFRVEHISYFKNGGTYTGGKSVGYDLVETYDPRNDKSLAYCTGEYQFDKQQMPERYEYEWMDEVSTLFQGFPLKVKSAFVQEGKKESVNVANFTSDIDYMVAFPEDIAKDGFALLAGIWAEGIKNPQKNRIDTPFESTGAGHFTIPRHEVYESSQGHNGRIYVTIRGDVPNDDVSLRFFDDEGEISTISNITKADGLARLLRVTIPEGITALAFAGTSGAIRAWVYAFYDDDLHQTPHNIITINGVTYVLQNGIMSLAYLQPNFLTYDMPSYDIVVNEEATTAKGLQRGKKQTLSFPVGENDPDVDKLVRTTIGYGHVDKMSVNLSSRTGKATLKYPNYEQ